jgi:GTP-binding protein HflX
VAVDVLLPYDRGDLVSRVHDEGELLEQDHRADGTWVRALVPAALAGELAPYMRSTAPTG